MSLEPEHGTGVIILKASIVFAIVFLLATGALAIIAIFIPALQSLILILVVIGVGIIILEMFAFNIINNEGKEKSDPDKPFSFRHISVDRQGNERVLFDSRVNKMEGDSHE